MRLEVEAALERTLSVMESMDALVNDTEKDSKTLRRDLKRLLAEARGVADKVAAEEAAEKLEAEAAETLETESRDPSSAKKKNMIL